MCVDVQVFLHTYLYINVSHADEWIYSQAEAIKKLKTEIKSMKQIQADRPAMYSDT